MRKAVLWLWVGLLLLGAACRQANPTPAPAAVPEPEALPPAAAEQTPAATAEEAAAAPPLVQSVAIVSAYRPDGLQSQELQFETPEFRQRVSTGVAVSVIPLGINLPPTQTRVLGVEKTPDPCSDSLPPWWEVQLAPLTQPEYVTAVSPYREAEDAAHYPYKVCVVYPALAQVQALNPGALDAAALPPGTRLEQVLLALDLNADQVPDLVVTEACCDKPQLPRKDCDLTCRKTWLRVGGQWKVIETGTPC